MPMGCKNGNASFQRLLDDIPKAVAGCADAFVDDIIVGSGTEGMTDEGLLAALKVTWGESWTSWSLCISPEVTTKPPSQSTK